MAKIKEMIWRALVAVSRAANALLAGTLNRAFGTKLFGRPGETVSSVLGRLAGQGNPRAVLLCRVLHVLDRGHCDKAARSGGSIE